MDADLRVGGALMGLPLSREESVTLYDAVTTDAAYAYLLAHGWTVNSSQPRTDGVVVHWLSHPEARFSLVMQQGAPRYMDASVRIADAVGACARVERQCECAVLLEMLAASLREVVR